ncbi:glycosyltransferase family 2 protein [Aequorivita flava]|uniref:Glycosyltransferase family A protein n=1 Tax=Aequorivita flava TaxID=3114371 RepID=A0AB35YVV4_9FLAO
MKLKVSIIMATFNRAHFIEETLISIQNQTFKNWECLIIDDGGTDNTEEIIQSFIQDKRFHYYKRSSKYAKGLSGCRNFGLDSAIGDYIIFFDDDDIIHPRNLEFCVKELENPFYFFCRYHREIFTGDFHYYFSNISNYKIIELNGKTTVKKLLTQELPFNSCAIMWKKECYVNNVFIESLQYAEEWELYSRILSNGFNGVSINATLYYGRKHSNSNTGEFWRGNEKRMQSKIEATKLVISNLEAKKILDTSLIKYFSWESVRLKSPALFSHLMKQPSLNTIHRLKEKMRYFGSPLIHVILRIKKRLR